MQGEIKKSIIVIVIIIIIQVDKKDVFQWYEINLLQVQVSQKLNISKMVYE